MRQIFSELARLQEKVEQGGVACTTEREESWHAVNVDGKRTQPKEFSLLPSCSPRDAGRHDANVLVIQKLGDQSSQTVRVRKIDAGEEAFLYLVQRGVQLKVSAEDRGGGIAYTFFFQSCASFADVSAVCLLARTTTRSAQACITSKRNLDFIKATNITDATLKGIIDKHLDMVEKSGSKATDSIGHSVFHTKWRR